MSDEDALESLTIAQLRKFANHAGIPFARDTTKDELIAKIKDAQNRRNLAAPVNENVGPKPGYTRILIHKDPSTGVKAGSRPVTVRVNGYVVTIPRGIPQDVPHKVVEVLQHSTKPQVVEDPSLPASDPQKFRMESVHSYPFQILASTPGPDPVSSWDKMREATYRPRERYRELFGRWPTRAALREAIKEGFIKLGSGETLGSVVADSDKDD